MVLAMAGVVHDFDDHGLAWRAFVMLVIVQWTGRAAALLNWRVIADRSGLRLVGPWRAQHLSWDRLAFASVAHREGELVIKGADGFRWCPGTLGSSWGKGPSRQRHVRAAQEIMVLLDQPELRPTGESGRSGRGWPLAPVLLAFYVVEAATVLIG